MDPNIASDQYGDEQKFDNRRKDNRRSNRGGGMAGGPPQPYHNQMMRKDFIKERLESINGPTHELQTREGPSDAKKFTGRCRLFVGNMPSSMTDEDFNKMFQQFGEIAEVFLNKPKGFGFVKLDTRHNAEAAKAGLDNTVKDGKCLRVRFATHGAALKVKNLSPWVSNELLELAFSIFGELERAVVIVDDRGRPIGEGIVEFARKQSAQLALKRCTEECFLLTSSPRPVAVELLEQRDEEDGLVEKNLPKANKQYLKEREVGPRLAEPGSFEFEFSHRWKKLYELEQQKRDHLEKEILEGRNALDEQMEFSIYEHEANLLRERLRHMEEQSSLLQREREMRLQEEMRREEIRRQEEMMLRQQQEEILRRCSLNDMHSREEENLYMPESAAYMQMPGGPLSPTMGGDPMNQGTGYGQGPNGMPSGGGMPPPRKTRFDQPPMGPAFPPVSESMNMKDMDMHGGMPLEMPDGEDYQDPKRRRY